MEEIYEVLIPDLVNEEVVNKEIIIEKFVNVYIENFGLNFTAFLENIEEKYVNMVYISSIKPTYTSNLSCMLLTDQQQSGS